MTKHNIPDDVVMGFVSVVDVRELVVLDNLAALVINTKYVFRSLTTLYVCSLGIPIQSSFQAIAVNCLGIGILLSRARGKKKIEASLYSRLV